MSPKARNLGRRVRVGDGRETRTGRRIGVRDSAVSVLITTHGESTEVAYLQRLANADWLSPRIGKRKVLFINGSPEQLVKKTARTWMQTGYDLAFAVADTDSFDIAKAAQAAEASGVELLVSNPCFETWLVLHFERCSAYLAGAGDAAARLRRHLPDYDKTALDYSDFAAHVHRAAANARERSDAPFSNPSSTLWKLVEVLREPPD